MRSGPSPQEADGGESTESWNCDLGADGTTTATNADSREEIVKGETVLEARRRFQAWKVAVETPFSRTELVDRETCCRSSAIRLVLVLTAGHGRLEGRSRPKRTPGMLHLI
jgi:hypothetical protein